MTNLIEILAHIPAHPLVHALGWTLLHFCWQGALVAAILWCVLGLLDGHSSQARYGASCLALGLLIALPVATFAHVASAEYALRADAWNYGIVLDPGIVLQVGVDAPTEPWPVRLAVALDHCVPWILIAWFAGVVVFVGRLNFGLMVARRLKKAETETPPSELLQAFDALRVRLGIARAVGLLHSARVQVPTVIGWLRPVVLIPASCLTGLSAEQIEAIFCHELAHVRRHDYLVSVFQSVVETLLFYHPAVWWVSKQVRRERECCCDAVAVGIGGDVLAYARALSYLEERRAAFPEFVLGANGGALKMRIKRLLGRPENSAASQVASIALLAILIVGAGAAAGKRVHAQGAAAQPAANPSAATSAADIVQQTLGQVETDAQQRTHDALASEIEQLQQQLSEIDKTSPQLQRQIKDAKRKAEETIRELQALKNKGSEDSLSQQAGESASQYLELRMQLKESQRKAQETLKTLNSDQLRKQFAEAQAAMAKISSDQLLKQLDEAFKNQDNLIYRQRLEGELNSPELKKQVQDALAAMARLNSPESRKQLDDTIKSAGNLNPADLQRRFNQLLAENKALAQGYLYTTQPDPATTAPDAVSIPPGVLKGNLIYSVDPVYPEIAKQAHVQGVVVLHALISKTGAVEDVQVVSGAPMLVSSAIDAVKQWKYKPCVLNGEIVEVETTINVNFTFGEPSKPNVPNPLGDAASNTPDKTEGGTSAVAPLARNLRFFSYNAGSNIRSIDYKGLNSVTITEVAARFQRDDIGLRLETPYDPARINRAAASLKALLAEHGRLTPIIRLETHPIPPKAIGILFDVTEGPKSKAGTSGAIAASHLEPQVATFNPAAKLQRIGGNVSSPELIYKVDPEFSPEARKAKASGIVLVNFVVDQQGLPQNVHVLRRIRYGLDAKAVEAVKQYQFRPAMESGEPVPVPLNVEVNFQVF